MCIYNLINILYYLGHYIYIEASSPRRPNDKARIISGQVTNMATSCLTFYYHMYGRNIGTLNVYMRQNNRNGVAIWSRRRNQGNTWNIAQVTLKAAKSYQVFRVISLYLRL